MTTLTREDIVEPLQHKKLGPLIHREDADRSRANIARQELALKIANVTDFIQDMLRSADICKDNVMLKDAQVELLYLTRILRSAQVSPETNSGEKKE